MHAGLGAVARSEGIIDVDIGDGCQAIDVSRVVPLFLTGVEADVFQNHHAPCQQSLGFGMGIRTAGIGSQHDRLSEQFT